MKFLVFCVVFLSIFLSASCGYADQFVVVKIDPGRSLAAYKFKINKCYNPTIVTDPAALKGVSLKGVWRGSGDNLIFDCKVDNSEYRDLLQIVEGSGGVEGFNDARGVNKCLLRKDEEKIEWTYGWGAGNCNDFIVMQFIGFNGDLIVAKRSIKNATGIRVVRKFPGGWHLNYWLPLTYSFEDVKTVDLHVYEIAQGFLINEQ
jgi:hypothetical protein